MDTIISRRLSSDRLYAYHRNRFWLWDDTRHSWKESHLMSQKFEREHSAPEVRVKAAGGISSLADAELFLSLGADRLGTSRLIRLVREEKENKTC